MGTNVFVFAVFIDNGTETQVREADSHLGGFYHALLSYMGQRETLHPPFFL